MKRLLAALTLIICLSFPASAGHVMGDGKLCTCNNPNHETMGLRVQNDEVEDTHQEVPNIDLGLLLVAVLLVLRFRA